MFSDTLVPTYAKKRTQFLNSVGGGLIGDRTVALSHQMCRRGVGRRSAGLCWGLVHLNHLHCPSEVALTHFKWDQWRAVLSEGLIKDTMVKILAGLMKTLPVSFKHKHTERQMLTVCYPTLCHYSLDMAGTEWKHFARLLKSVASQIS